MKIGVYGSAAGSIEEEVRVKARKIGRYIAEESHVLVTGACPGLPYDAVVGANEINGCECIGFSPTTSEKEHRDAGLPVKGFTDFVYVPEDYEHAGDLAVCTKYRNVSSVSYVDAAIIIGGRAGTMNEFVIAYDMGVDIGVLRGSGGITDRVIDIFLSDIDKKSASNIIFESDPEELVKKLLKRESWG